MSGDKDELAGPGHNNPPEATEPPPPRTLQEDLGERYKDLTARIAELKKLADAAPAEVTTEEVFKPLSDLLKAGRVALAMSESTRKIENEESRKRTAMIDAWFKNPADELSKVLKAVKDRTDAYLDDKKAKEQKARQEEADRKAKLAEDKRWDAVWSDARAELAAYDARKAEEAATAARLVKEAAARRADHLRDRVKRLKAVEPYLADRAERRRKAEEDEAARLRQLALDEEARVEADRLAEERRVETKRKSDEDAARVAQARLDAAAELEAARKETAAARRTETRQADKAEALDAAAEDHAEEAEEAGGAADRLGKRAERAERRANASPAELSRTRSEMGTTSSQTRSWKVISVDKNSVDLNMLRGYLHPDAVETAARGYMMAHRTDDGGPKLAGCVFEQVEEGAYR